MTGRAEGTKTVSCSKCHEHLSVIVQWSLVNGLHRSHACTDLRPEKCTAERQLLQRAQQACAWCALQSSLTCLNANASKSYHVQGNSDKLLLGAQGKDMSNSPRLGTEANDIPTHP